MFGNILFRMLLKELAIVFALAFVGISGILLMFGIVAELMHQSIGPGQILAAIPLVFPATLPYSLPYTTLFTACVVYGRLSADNECVPLKAAGINLITLIKPGIVFGLVLSLCSMGFYFQVIPYAQYLLRCMTFADVEELLYARLRNQGHISYPLTSFSIFVKGVDGRKLINPIFKHKDENKGTTLIAQAREAELRVNPSRGEALIHMRDGVATGSDGFRAYFESRVFEVELSDKFNTDANKRPRMMVWGELHSRQTELQEALRQEEDLAEALPSGRSDANAAGETKTRKRILELSHQAREIKVELLLRPAMAAGCFFFILVGCPVALWSNRGDFLGSFIVCFLPIIAIYYPLMLCGINMAKADRFDPVVLLWAPNLLIGVVGLGLLLRFVRS